MFFFNHVFSSKVFFLNRKAFTHAMFFQTGFCYIYIATVLHAKNIHQFSDVSSESLFKKIDLKPMAKLRFKSLIKS